MRALQRAGSVDGAELPPFFGKRLARRGRVLDDLVEMSMFQHSYPFDPTYGFDQEALLNVELPVDVPDDFEEFWRGLYAEAMAVEPEAEFESLFGREDFQTERMTYRSVGGRRIGGWLTTPSSGKIERLVVVGTGYGGKTENDARPVMEGAACLHFCARGLPERSVADDLPSKSGFHVLVGIEDRSTYIHGGCCADLWLAATVLRERFGGELPLHYWGGSFGGGIGALALPWDDRFRAAYLRVPSFGNHPLRLQCQCVGSGEAVRLKWRRAPSIIGTLRYFDSAAAARFLRLPTYYGCALFDPAVPPPGQFSVWRAHAGRKELRVLSAGHFEHPGADAERADLDRRAGEFLRGAEPVGSGAG